MTHDLMSNIFRELGIRLVKVTVNDFSEQVYYASLHLQLPGDSQLQEIDARPSDAIALALRAQCRILVAAQVAEKTGIQIDEAIDDDDDNEAPAPEPAPEELDKFMKLMDGVDLSGESGKN